MAGRNGRTGQAEPPLSRAGQTEQPDRRTGQTQKTGRRGLGCRTDRTGTCTAAETEAVRTVKAAQEGPKKACVSASDRGCLHDSIVPHDRIYGGGFGI